jgi:hypothetical protein
MSNTTATLPILEALNTTYQRIRADHPEVPNAVIVVGAPGKVRGGQVHGHFLAQSWANPDFQDAETDSDFLHEISLSGESLERGADHVLGTLIHEAAHALAFERGIKDTSNGARYHNKKFKAVAEELGILLEQAPTIGWSVTRISTVTYLRFYEELINLRWALGTYRLPEYSVKPKVRKRTKAPMDCGCDDPVTVSIQWFERHAESLTCEDCFEKFHLIDEDEEDV